MLAQPKNACQRLLVNSLPLTHKDGAAQLCDIISLIQSDPTLSPFWGPAPDNDQPLWKRVILALERAHVQVKVPSVRFRAVQRALYEIWQRDGLDLSISGPVMSAAISHGLPELVLQRDQSQPLSSQDLEAISENKMAMISGNLKTLSGAWQNHPGLLSIVRDWENQSRGWEWMGPNTTQATLPSRRPSQPWTQEEADLYMRLRVYPDWEKHTTHMLPNSIFIATRVVYNSQTLIQKVSPQVWSEILYSGSAGKTSEFLVNLRRAYGTASRKIKLDIPSPPDDYLSSLVDKYSQMKAKHLLEDPERAKVLRDFAFASLEEMISTPDLDWSRLGIVLHAYCLASPSAPPPNKVQSWVGTRLEAKPSYPSLGQGSPPIRRGLLLSLWILGSPKDEVVSFLDRWEDRHGFSGSKLRAEESNYHNRLANSLFIRFSRAKDSKEHWPALASAFWTHALRCEPSTIRSLLNKVMLPVPPTRPDIFAIDINSSQLRKMLDNVDNLPKMKSAQDDTALRRCVLRLTALFSGPASRASQPRM